MPLISASRLHRFISETLQTAGLSAAEAATCADAAVFADLRGATTHGIVYIVPRTLESISDGKTVSGSAMQVIKERGATALVKGAGVVGPVLASEAMRMAMAKAREHGIGAVNTFNGNPIGLLGYYAHLAAEEGLVGLVMANTAPAAAPHGGTTAVLGTNPFAYAAPAEASPPILFDIATTVASSGKLAQARRRGTELPAGWMIDRDGNAVTDPARSGDGVMLPCGGHKGSGLGILIHLLTGGLSETTVGGEPTHNHPDPERRGQGALFIAIDPDGFGTGAGFAGMVERQIGFVHGSAPLPGRTGPVYPGERGWSESDKRRKDGIPVPAEDWQAVAKSVRSAGLPETLLADVEREVASA
jgi:ureidoglycolate dehydrogenase (NAD+)